MLLPKSIYRPARKLAEDFLSAFSVDIELYDPLIGSAIDSLIRPETTMVWCESPGSITMEVQDIRAIAGAARRKNVVVAIDNTYAAGVLLDAFELGADVSIQSLSKYIGGHSDLLLGSISVDNGSNWEKIERSHRMMGISVSPDECSLALRGLTTLGVRLDHLEKATLDIARHLKQRSEISIVLHPALSDCPGHDIWSKEFKGSASVFSIVFEERWEKRHVETFVNALRLFKIGYGWGGSTSLVMAYPNMSTQRHRDSQRLVRLNVGFESVSDLIFDLDAAIAYARP
jgi:cystathionine beta-lyase